MEVILLERIEKLGQMGDVVSVKPGFARNYLLPMKKALRSNKANLAYFEEQKVQLEANNLKRRDEAQAVADKMDGLSILMVRQAGETGQLYGSVTARDICDAVKEEGFSVERYQILLNAPIKELGSYGVHVKLHPEVIQDVAINVARSEEEAKRQAAAAEKAAKTGLVQEIATTEETPAEAEAETVATSEENTEEKEA
ncbi:MAG: 50S ribosomal protein L9 [Alphaproteobacteria bacterium]|nr:50S ribosomal protein L9 [Alphaproteobacteria bacterium]